MKLGTIVYIGGFELPDKNAAAQRVINNSKLLRDIGYNIIFIGIDKRLNIYKSIFDTKNIFFDFETYVLPYPRNSFQWVKYIFTFKYYHQIIKRNKNIELIICYNLPAGSLFFLFLYSKLRNIIIFSDCTEWYDTSKSSGFFFKIIKKLDVFFRMKVINPKLDGVISISKFLFDFYKKKGTKTILIPPLIDILDVKWRQNKLIKKNILRLVYAGSPFSSKSKDSPKDRIDIILKSLAKLKKESNSFEMKVIGVEKESILSLFPELSSTLKLLGDSVTFYGILSHQSAIHILCESDFSIFIRDENIVTKAGFPTKFVESITCGVPVLTNNSSNISDYLIEGENGFFIDILNEDTIYVSIQKAFNVTPEKIQSMKEFCFDSKLFDYRKYIDPFKQFLNY